MNTASNEGESPREFRVAVLTKRRPVPPKPWLRESWQVIGVVAHSHPASGGSATLVRRAADGDQYLWGGLSIRLHKDEVESYYYNLLSARPSLYVISSVDEHGDLEPFRVSACFDEANAYDAAGQSVETVPMPPELYRWVESFVIDNYAPEAPKKRQRKDWTESDHEQR